MLITGLKETGGHKIKIITFTDNTTILLRYITCLNPIQDEGQIEIMITSLMQMLGLPNFGHITTSIT